jgi:hypothetical protein
MSYRNPVIPPVPPATRGANLSVPETRAINEGEDMNYYTSSQLAEIRRQELTADATGYRQTRRYRRRTDNHPRRPSAFRNWLAAGQL